MTREEAVKRVREEMLEVLEAETAISSFNQAREELLKRAESGEELEPQGDIRTRDDVWMLFDVIEKLYAYISKFEG